MHDVILITVSGEDKPGLSASLLGILAQYETKILDIGQAVIHSTLSLGILTRVPEGVPWAVVARELLARSRPGVLHAGLKACDDWRTGAAAAGRIACPTLVVIGTQDVMTPPKQGRALAGMIADCRKVVIRDCGHMMMQEAPDAVLDALIESLRSD